MFLSLFLYGILSQERWKALQRAEFTAGAQGAVPVALAGQNHKLQPTDSPILPSTRSAVEKASVTAPGNSLGWPCFLAKDSKRGEVVGLRKQVPVSTKG